MPKPKILLVEDEASIREGVCDVLAYHGYQPAFAESGPDGLARATNEDFPLVLLDVMLPGMSGLDVCKALRANDPNQLILMLTAKGSEDDIIAGFGAGADDYVTKPFSVRELVVRVEALLRRAAPPATMPDVFQFGAWRIDPSLRVAQKDETSSAPVVSDPIEVDLTAREVALLSVFVREKGRIVSRRRLLADVWQMAGADDVETRTVDMHIAKLRKKIGGGREALIETVRGAGYRFSG